ncbi:DNA utilization protein GntX [Enterobacteriaceae bacterium LUAb1]
MLPIPALCWLCQMPLKLTCHGICSFCLRTLPLPVCCPQCGLPSAHSHQPCGRCLKHPPHWQRLLAVSDYSPPLSLLIKHFKFTDTTALTAPLARLMLLRWLKVHHQHDHQRPDLLLSVPLHRRRIWQRGYNQADLLARQLAYWLRYDYAPHALCRIRYGRPQRDLSAQIRRRNVRGAFRVEMAVKGLHIALIDDVVTTGSTVGEISRVLHAAGVASVQIWCLCRTL